MSKKDKSIELLAGQVRDRTQNRMTRVTSWGRTSLVVDMSLVFGIHYAGFRERLASYARPGVAVVAIDCAGSRVAGVGFAAAKAGEPNVLIVGRHSQADLLLTSDESVSLRHCALVVEPTGESGEVRYRVMDLRSTQGFRTEEGKELGGLRADGPAFVTAGQYAFFFFVTGPEMEWPESAAVAWQRLPKRVYLEEMARLAHGTGPHPRAPKKEGDAQVVRQGITLVRAMGTPQRVAAGSLVTHGESQVAELLLAWKMGELRIPVGQAALSHGILLGRLDRCDAGMDTYDSLLSRIHLLIIEIGDAVYAIDTASSNGSYLDKPEGDSFRLHELASRDVVWLADAMAVSWGWAN